MLLPLLRIRLTILILAATTTTTVVLSEIDFNFETSCQLKRGVLFDLQMVARKEEEEEEGEESEETTGSQNTKDKNPPYYVGLIQAYFHPSSLVRSFCQEATTLVTSILNGLLS